MFRTWSRERHLDRLYARLEQRRCDWANDHRTGPLMDWSRARFDMTEMAVLVPIPEPHLHDPDGDLWADPAVRHLLFGDRR